MMKSQVKKIKERNFLIGFILFLIITSGLIFVNLTGLVTYEPDKIILEFTGELTNNAYILISIDGVESKKQLEDYGYSLVNDTYNINNIEIPIAELNLDKTSNVVVTLIDQETTKAITSKIITVTEETIEQFPTIIKEPEENITETLEENVTQETIEQFPTIIKEPSPTTGEVIENKTKETIEAFPTIIKENITIISNQSNLTLINETIQANQTNITENKTITAAGLVTISSLEEMQPIPGVPRTINIQGKLIDPNNHVLTGTYSFNFSLYNVNSGGNALWSEIQSLTTDNNGIYNALLGSINPIKLDFSQQYYLGIKIAADNEMTPRINLTSTPYAFRALYAENLTCTDCELTGNLTIGGILNVTGQTYLSNVNISGIQFTGGNIEAKNLTLAQKITFAFGQTIDNIINGLITVTGNTFVTGNLTIGENVTVRSNLTIEKDLIVKGITYLGNFVFDKNALFTGNLTINNNLTVIGNTHLLGNLTLQEDASLRRNVTISDSLTVTRLLTIGANTLFVNPIAGLVSIGSLTPSAVLDIKRAGDGNYAMNISGLLYVNDTNVAIGALTSSQKLKIVGTINASVSGTEIRTEDDGDVIISLGE